MSWLYERRRCVSPHNGVVDVERILGMWRVSVDGYQQSGPVVSAIWRDALERVRDRIVASPRVLVLGLGTGGSLKVVHRLLPHCTITAVEHDPTMIALTKELRLYAPYPQPRLLEGDASVVLALLDEAFDVVLIDLFRGNMPADILADRTFLYAIKQHTATDGVVLMNACGKAACLDEMARIFPHEERWGYRKNRLGAFYQ